MPYQIKKSNGDLLVTIPDGVEYDQIISILLMGRSISNFAESLQNNILHIMENFANATSPDHPVEGQLWYDTQQNKIKVYTRISTVSFEWRTIGDLVRGNTPPLTPILGDMWYNTLDNQLYYYGKLGEGSVNSGLESWIRVSTAPGSVNPPNVSDGSIWWMVPEKILWVRDESINDPVPTFKRDDGSYLSGGWRKIGPLSSSSNNTGPVPDFIDGIPILKIYVDNELLGIWSSIYIPRTSPVEDSFTTVQYINGVATPGYDLYPGLNLNYSLGLKIIGTALNSEHLEGFKSSDFVGRGNNLLSSDPIVNNTSLGSELFRWKVYGTTFYGGTSNDSTIDTSSITFRGKAAAADATDSAIKLANKLVLRTHGNPAEETSVEGDVMITSIRADSSGLPGIAFDGSEQTSLPFIKLEFSPEGEQRIVDIATDVVAQGNSNLGQFIRKDGVTTNFSGNMGNSADKFSTIYANVFNGVATQAQYADLAERYESDKIYEPGTVVKIGGIKEITQTTEAYDDEVFGVISTKPGFLMNSETGNDDSHPAVVMIGRSPVKVVGKLKKGQRLVTSSIPGVAMGMTETCRSPLHIIGRSLVEKDSDAIDLIEAVLGVK